MSRVAREYKSKIPGIVYKFEAVINRLQKKEVEPRGGKLKDDEIKFI